MRQDSGIWNCLTCPHIDLIRLSLIFPMSYRNSETLNLGSDSAYERSHYSCPIRRLQVAGYHTGSFFCGNRLKRASAGLIPETRLGKPAFIAVLPFTD